MSRRGRPTWEPMELQQSIAYEGEQTQWRYRDREAVTVRYEAWRNRLYDAAVIHFDNGALHISFKRIDRSAVRDWRHFQAIKNEIAGPEREAVELFPPESQLMDGANQYHLWVFPAGESLWLGMAMPNGAELLDAFESMDGAVYRERSRRGLRTDQPGGRQRGWEDGIPTGLGRGTRPGRG